MLNIIRTGLDAANHEIAVLSHNLANAGTAGFKRSNTVFEDHYGDNIAQLASKYTGHGTVAHAPRQNHDQGGLRPTGGALDFAVMGRGYFMLQKPDDPGGRLYSRDGSFQMANDGLIVNNLGQPLLSAEQEVMRLPLSVNVPGEGLVMLDEIQLSPNGVIKGKYGRETVLTIGQIGLARFMNSNMLEPRGLSQFAETTGSGNPLLGAADQLGFGTIAGGNLEMANTTVSDELVSIIRAQQSFSGMSRVMQAEVDMVKRFSQGS